MYMNLSLTNRNDKFLARFILTDPEKPCHEGYSWQLPIDAKDNAKDPTASYSREKKFSTSRHHSP